MYLLREWRLIINEADPATHSSCLLLLLTVNLHNVVHNIKVIVYGVSSRKYILRDLVWLLIILIATSSRV
jgi:hypothetical protein